MGKIIEEKLRYTMLRSKGEIAVRKASEVEYGFPYSSKLVCYIEQTKDKEIRWIQNYAQEKRDIYYRVKNEGSKLYAVWPG